MVLPTAASCEFEGIRASKWRRKGRRQRGRCKTGVSSPGVELRAWYETAGGVELLKNADQFWNTGHVLAAAPTAEADTWAVVRRVQLTGSICYWGVMNAGDMNHRRFISCRKKATPASSAQWQWK